MKKLSRLLSTLGSLSIVGTMIYIFFLSNDDLSVTVESSLFKIGIYGGIALIVCSTLLSLFGLKSAKVKNGEAALGIIRNFTQTGTYVNEQPQVEIQLDVVKRSGENFQGQVTTIVPLTQLAALQIGAPIQVVTNDARKVGLPKNGDPTLSQDETQHLFEEFGIKQGFMDAEAVKIGREGVKSYATVTGMRPLNSMSDAKVTVSLDLEVALKDHTTKLVTVEKTVFNEALDQIQPGRVIEVIYLENNVEKLVIQTKSSAEKTFHAILNE
ncbi:MULTISPECIES: hypothetical protein [Listeria]|uniref:hypothetical protein n=1 Tax=Listeria TaxID=1637 RepID=UPI000B597423|nr:MULTISPECIES: hypothetical protein [Listeria]